MKTSVNNFRLKGFVGNEPEITNLENASKLVTLRIATNENYTDKNGEKKTITDWHSVTLWNSVAEYAEKNVKKGSLVIVEGRIKPRSYENKEGQKAYTIDFVVDQLDIILTVKEEKE